MGAHIDSREVLGGARLRQAPPGPHAVQIEQPDPRIIVSAGDEQVLEFQVAVVEARAVQPAHLPGQPRQVNVEPGALGRWRHLRPEGPQEFRQIHSFRNRLGEQVAFAGCGFPSFDKQDRARSVDLPPEQGVAEFPSLANW